MEFKLVLNNNISNACDLLKECYDIEVSENNFKKIIDNNNTKCIVALESDVVIGMCIINKLTDYVINKNYYYVNYVCVKNEYRNKGIGRSLMQYVEELGNIDNISYIMLTSNKSRIFAHKLYNSLGYNIKDTSLFIKTLD